MAVGIYVSSLFNNILHTGNIPLVWKTAVVRPVHKKGDMSSITNYRPISNLSSLSKLFERVLLNLLNTLHPDLDGVNQHGFRSKHSTITAALAIQHELSTSLDRKLCVGVYSVDLNAAFDLVDVNVFQKVGERKEINPWLLRTLANFLRDRSAAVHIGKENSGRFKLDVG